MAAVYRSRVDRNKEGVCFLEKSIRTEGKTIVVDGKNPKPLALLDLPSGSPPNVANSSEINLDAKRVRWGGDVHEGFWWVCAPRPRKLEPVLEGFCIQSVRPF